MLRREVVGILGAAALSRGERKSADATLKELMAGNERFAAGKAIHPRRRPEDFSRLASGQTPDAVIVGCADSRVPPEVLFDQGLGDLFVVRVAGNVIRDAGAIVKGSIAYATVALGAVLIFVLGHSDCGAVKSALAPKGKPLPGSIQELLGLIDTGGETDLNRAIAANVRAGVTKLRSLEPNMAGFVETGRLKVVGGVYELATGKVNLIP